MFRLTVFASMLAVGIASWARKPQPNRPIRPILRRQGAEPDWRAHTPCRDRVQTHHASPRPGGTLPNMKSQRGYHLSTPRAHGL